MSIGLAKLMKRRIDAISAVRGDYHGFTLLEIMLAVAILGMMAIAIFRFVQTNLTAQRPQTRSMTVFVICLQLNGKA